MTSDTTHNATSVAWTAPDTTLDTNDIPVPSSDSVDIISLLTAPITTTIDYTSSYYNTWSPHTPSVAIAADNRKGRRRPILTIPPNLSPVTIIPKQHSSVSTRSIEDIEESIRTLMKEMMKNRKNSV